MFQTLIKGALCATVLLAPAARSVLAQPAAAMTKTDKPFLHPMFSENAVLQRDRPLTVWGWTTPNKTVVVKFDGLSQTVRAAADGRWSAPIGAQKAGGPHTLVVAGSSRGEYARRDNLLFGDVWLCSGQSNMEFPMSNLNNAAAAISAVNNPQIRLLHVPNTVQSAPVDTFQNANWQVCTPQTVGPFSAVGYFFGRKLNQDLNVPIGLIESSWGGTPAESWTSESALRKMGDFNGAIDLMEQNAANPQSLDAQRAAWWQNDQGTKSGWNKADINAADWKTMAVPAAWEDKGYADFDGVMWFRREVDVPASLAGRDLTLNLGNIDDDDTTYWNGDLIGETRGYGNARNYTVSGAQVKAGVNVIAIRVLDTGGGGGLRSEMSFGPAGESKRMTLDGDWKYRLGASLKDAPPLPRETDQNTPTALYNGMISPLLPGQIKGVIWYQGEQNADRAKQYQTLLPTLIGDWRARFGAATGAPMPFYIVQLANFMAPNDQPGDDNWAYLREAQSLTAQNVPDTGIAVISDIGEENDIHPKNKQDVGLRLALAALHQTYGENIEYSGPTLKSVKVSGGALQLTFDHADTLTLKGDQNRVFAIAGADKKFRWATPQINGNTIMLSSPDVAAPLYARFGWSNNPRASLYNGAGLPASLFRTDQ